MKRELYSKQFLATYMKGISLARTDARMCINLLEPLMDEANRVAEISLLADFYYYLGNACFMVGDNNKGIEYLGRSMIYYEADGDYRHLFHVQSLLGVTFLNQGKYSEAMELFLNEFDTAIKYEVSSAMYKANFHIAQCYFVNHRYQKAIEYLDSAYGMLKFHPNIYTETESIPMFYALYTVNLVLLGRSNDAKDVFDEYRKVIGDYPRFKDGPYFMVPKYCVERLFGGDEKQLLEDAINSCLLDNLNAGENMVVLNLFLSYLLSIKDVDSMDRILPKMERLLVGTDYYRYMLLVKRARLYCAQYKKDFIFLNEQLNDYWDLLEKEEKASGEFIDMYVELKQGITNVNRENKELTIQANTDALTNLPNRRYLNQIEEEWFEKAYHNRKIFAIEILDVDYFKDINDKYGHLSGDRCLKVVADIIRDCCDNENIFVARYGGDEFTILYYDCEFDYIVNTMRSIRLAINTLEPINGEIRLSVSQGAYACVPQDHNKEWDFSSRADKALYVVKRKEKGHLNFVSDVKEYYE